MDITNFKTAWIWDAEHHIYGREIYGLDIDPKQGEFHWHHGDTGSLRGDDDGFMKQTVSEFQCLGPPQSFGELPVSICPQSSFFLPKACSFLPKSLD